MDMPFHESESTRLNWRKSARSVNNGNCTEVASTDGIVVVRDSTDQAGPRITYSAATWRNFGQSVRQGRFDIQNLGDLPEDLCIGPEIQVGCVKRKRAA